MSLLLLAISVCFLGGLWASHSLSAHAEAAGPLSPGVEQIKLFIADIGGLGPDTKGLERQVNDWLVQNTHGVEVVRMESSLAAGTGHVYMGLTLHYRYRRGAH